MPMNEKKIDGFYKYEIEEAARTIIRTQEIAKKPKLWKLAKAEVAKQAKAANAAVKWSQNI